MMDPRYLWRPQPSQPPAAPEPDNDYGMFGPGTQDPLSLLNVLPDWGAFGPPTASAPQTPTYKPENTAPQTPLPPGTPDLKSWMNYEPETQVAETPGVAPEPEIARIRREGNVTENRAGGLRGQDWLQSGGGGMSNWTGRMKAAGSVDPLQLSAAQTETDAKWRASLADRYGTTEENTFDPRREEMDTAQHGLDLAKIGQQTEIAQMTPQELAGMQNRPDARVMAFQFAQRVLGTPEQKEQELLEAYETQYGRPLTAQETAALKLVARKMWEKAADQMITQAQTQRESFGP